ncbi:hypothetical protein HY994_06800 [Candidatus Micrarchaeota archaeon]|nr:hypothetical protein [Candidatus Micrarchaeota archaeon]
MKLFGRKNGRTLRQTLAQTRGVQAIRKTAAGLVTLVRNTGKPAARSAALVGASAAATMLGTVVHETGHAIASKMVGASVHGIILPKYYGGGLLAHYFPSLYFTPETMNTIPNAGYSQVSHLQSAFISGAPNVAMMAIGATMMSASLRSAQGRAERVPLATFIGRNRKSKKWHPLIQHAHEHIQAHAFAGMPASPVGFAGASIGGKWNQQYTMRVGRKLRPALFAAGLTLMLNHVKYGMANIPGGDFNQVGAHAMAWLNEKIPAWGYHPDWAHAVGAATVFGTAYALYKLPSYAAVAFKRIGQIIRQNRHNAYSNRAANAGTHFENVARNGQTRFSLMDALKKRRK